MSLDLSQVAVQIAGLAHRLKTEGKGRLERLEHAVNLFHAVEIDSLGRKIEASADRVAWPVAGLAGGLAVSYPVPECPPCFTVAATDGSHIDVDRHSSARCYLINIGRVVLRYGDSPDARLDSEASLYFGDELTLTDPRNGRRELVEGALLGVKRSIAELQALEELSSGLPTDNPTLALVDGSLILWGLSPRDYEGYIKEELLDRQYLQTLDRLERRAGGGGFALASYISYPRSAEVVNALRLWLCPHEIADCERGGCQRECDAVAGIIDSDIFESLLEPGWRSAIFLNGSRFMQKHYGGHQVYFCYVRLDEEVARVELPQWVAADENLVGMVHALVLDQCRRGHGYPVALMEAHEKAVVTGADREGFRLLMERALADEKVELRSSGKSMSKRTRWV
jgi:GNAT superfamily N-acetyltransferase